MPDRSDAGSAQFTQPLRGRHRAIVDRSNQSANLVPVYPDVRGANGLSDERRECRVLGLPIGHVEALIGQVADVRCKPEPQGLVYFIVPFVKRPQLQDTRMTKRLVTVDESNPRENVKRVPATERVLDYILAEMDAGRLGPGLRVNAARIAATLHLSAAPVREALSILAGRGVLDLLPDRGAIMRLIRPREVAQMWEVIAEMAALGLRLAGRAVAAGADAAEVDERYQEIGRDPLSISPISFLLRLNEYHWAVHRLGGNEFVTLALERLSVPYWDRFLAGLIDVHANMQGYLTNYRRMHEALMVGDGEAAAAVIRYHAEWSVRLIQHAIEEVGVRRRRKPNK